MNCKWTMKFYFLHMKSDEVGTTLKHPKTINGSVKNLSWHFLLFHFLSFYFKNLTLALIASLTNSLEFYPLSLFCLTRSFGVPKHFKYRDVAKSTCCNLAKGGVWASPHWLGGRPDAPLFWGCVPHLGKRFPVRFPAFPKSFPVPGTWGSSGTRTPPWGTHPRGTLG